VDSRFFGFPLSTPLPLNYYQDYPRKEYLQISLSAEFSTFESFADFPYTHSTGTFLIGGESPNRMKVRHEPPAHKGYHGKQGW
jgi:hypothetical protein